MSDIKDKDHQPEEVPDDELVVLAKQGNHEAYDQLVTKYRGRVYAMIFRMTRSDADAWDLSQDAFIKAWKALPKYEQRASFYTWLYRIAHNVTYDWLRKKKISLGVEFDDQISMNYVDTSASTVPKKINTPAENMMSSELRGEIEEALGKLSPDHRAVILMKEVEGLSYQEIADVLECSHGTVMSRLFYARKKLQTLLKI